MGIRKYRVDRTEENGHGQKEQVCYWLGGRQLSAVEAVCEDGATRTAYVQGEADTWFSLPAVVSIKGKPRKGWLGLDEGLWQFHLDSESR